MPVTHSTFTIERNFPAPPDRVFHTFADPALKRTWFAEGHNLDSHELDFRPGGKETTVSRFPAGSPFPGAELANHTVYLDIEPAARIVFAYTMSMNGRRFSASLATVEFFPTDAGTRMLFTDQGAYFEHSDGPEMRRDGWTQILSRIEA